MALADCTIRWVAASDADSSTDYEIWSDAETSGTMELIDTQDADFNGGGVNYTPLSSTLSGNMTATDTSFVVADATNFGDYLRIGQEMIFADTGAPNYTDATRGWGASLATAHTTGDTVWDAHESYPYADVPFMEDNSGRHVVRVEVRRRQGTNISVVARTMLVYPTVPLHNQLATVWGVEYLPNSSIPAAGYTATYSQVTAQMYHAGIGAQLQKGSVSTTLDADGYWELQLPKYAWVVGSPVATITITGGTTETLETYTIITVPPATFADADTNFVNIQECL